MKRPCDIRANILAAAILSGSCLLVPAASAEDLYRNGSWAALASDQRASQPGDILTVVVLENSDASNTIRNGTDRESRIGGDFGVGDTLNESAGLGLRGGFDGRGTIQRSGRLVAQISVTVNEVLPNGDLRVSGAQSLNVSGEQTYIQLRGRVRPADISSNNSVLSSRLADAAIDYDGRGFASRGARPGMLQRIFNFLGLM